MKVHVLLVASDSGARPPVQLFLENKDFVVTTVSEEESLLRFLKTIRPDTIIIDLTIPGLDGLKLIGEIRQSKGCAEVPLITLIAPAGGLHEKAPAVAATVIVKERECAHALAERVSELFVQG